MFLFSSSHKYSASEIVKHYIVSRVFERSKNFSVNQVLENTEDSHVIKLGGSDNFPIVMLIGGVGGSGKSTFIDFCKKHMYGVYEESTIDCCKQVVGFMSELETSVSNFSSLENEIIYKSDKYRTLLSVLKDIWCKTDDGPNNIAISMIKTRFQLANTSVVFLNVREPEQIEHLKAKLEEDCGAVVITVAVIRNNPKDYTNESDRKTLEYQYDLYIVNEGSIDVLEYQALNFCRAIEDANYKLKDLLNYCRES